MSRARIPLFPLELVLFPGMALPLHIFEPRYKLMVQRCLERQAAFGVVLAREGGIAPVGCTADILQVVKKYEDGRMDILTVGQDAFRIGEVLDEQPYLEGAVEYLADASQGADAAARKELMDLYAQCHGFVHGRPPDAPETDSGISLAHKMASELPLDLEFKQELLELRSEGERQAVLLERLRQWLPQLSRLERVRARSGGNGHGL